MSILRTFVIAFPLVLVAPGLASADDAPLPEASDVAERVLAGVGGRDGWDATRHVAWNFFGRRLLVWDKWTGDLRIQTEKAVILMNVHSKEGRVFSSGRELDGRDRAEALERGHAIFINDSYWMFLPFKLQDPGVTLSVVRREQGSTVLSLVFDGVGRTPENRYDVWVDDDSDLITQWAFYRTAEDEESRFVMPWAGWKRFGRIRLATDHGRGASWEIGVFDDLPDWIYTHRGRIDRRTLDRYAGR